MNVGEVEVPAACIVALEKRARANLGLFSAAWARSEGVSDRIVTYHSRPGGRWERVHPGVYRLTSIAPHRQQPLLAALLWAGPAAALSHRAAGWILGLDGMPPRAAPEVWAPRSHGCAGVTVHRGVLQPSDMTWTGHLRHTTLLRTAFDLAAWMDEDRLEVVIESVIRRDPRHEDALRTCTSRHMRKVLARRGAGVAATESELETLFIQLVRTVDLPPPVRQLRVMDEAGDVCVGRLDVAWPEATLWVELDGRAPHSVPKAVFADRHRQNYLIDHLKWQLLRYTWDDVTQRGRATARQVATTYWARLRVGGA